MRPGESTPVGQTILVDALAPAVQSQPTHAILPAASTSTCPPRSPPPGVSPVAVKSLVPPPAVTSHVPLDSGGRLALGHIVILGGMCVPMVPPSPVVTFVMSGVEPPSP